MYTARFFGASLALAAVFAFASTPARAAAGPCAEPGGMPRADGNAIQCTVSASVTQVGNKSLTSATLGLVKEVQAKSVLRLPLGADALMGILGQHVIQIPAQDITVDVVFSDGRVLPALITVAPSITVDGADACSLTATDAAINVSRFESGLPDWIDATVLRYVNESPEVKSKLLDGAAAALARVQSEYCF